MLGADTEGVAGPARARTRGTRAAAERDLECCRRMGSLYGRQTRTDPPPPYGPVTRVPVSRMGHGKIAQSD